MNEGTRRIYDFLNWHKKARNRINYLARFTTGMLCLVVFGASGFIVDGIRNSSLETLKHEWIKNEVKDIHNTNFASLDEEEPPRPLVVKTNIHRFKEEFAKKYM